MRRPALILLLAVAGCGSGAPTPAEHAAVLSDDLAQRECTDRAVARMDAGLVTREQAFAESHACREQVKARRAEDGGAP